MSVDVKYTAHASATGGRDGRAKTDDGSLDVKLVSPKELGGAGGDGNNPEQLFAMGYSACFIGAMKAAGAQTKIKVPSDVSVNAEVGIGPRSEGGFGLAVKLNVTLPGLDKADAEKLVETAHTICPYSNATRGNIDVTTAIA
ncbi:organic hydroperoxide resistance protein [Thalassospira sp. MA62]|nr:organic hydroperoxide resistance protein [Thalassospira sp. MA62]